MGEPRTDYCPGLYSTHTVANERLTKAQSPRLSVQNLPEMLNRPISWVLLLARIQEQLITQILGPSCYLQCRWFIWNELSIWMRHFGLLMRQFLGSIKYSVTTVYFLSHLFLVELFVSLREYQVRLVPPSHSIQSAKCGPLICTMGFPPNPRELFYLY